jgi:hypothetical protein
MLDNINEVMGSFSTVSADTRICGMLSCAYISNERFGTVKNAASGFPNAACILKSLNYQSSGRKYW